MRFAPSEEQEMLAEVSREYLEANPTPDWHALVEEQAWHSIALPEEVGGMGFGWVELTMVAEQVGRLLAPVPLLSSCALGAVAIRDNATPEQAAELLGRLAGGERASLVLKGHATIVGEGESARLTAHSDHVIGGAQADVLIVQAQERLFVVESTSVSRTQVAVFDETRPACAIAVDIPIDHVIELPSCELNGAICAGWVLQAAEAVGAAEFTLNQAVEYAKVRTQFGKPIGSFQAIKHKCADMLLQVESARSAAWYAAWALDAASPDAHEAARMAATVAADALFHCAAQSIQIHGGIGFTWEHGAHRYLRRARADMQLLGHPREHREALANELLGGP